MNIHARREQSAVLSCLRYRQQRLWLCVLAVTLAVSLMGFMLASPAAWASPDQPLDAPSLPDNCDELAQPGQDPPEACVFGYVYLDGSPVAGADVTIQAAGDLSLTTGAGPGSVEPYYAAALNEPPLSADMGTLVSVEASQSGEQNQTVFSVVEGAQQVDVYLSTTCGPTNTPGGLIDSNTTWTPACSPYIVSGNVIVQAGANLTVEPGTVVEFDAGRALQVDGGLFANARADALAVFTSHTNAVPGAWGYILLTSSSLSSLDYVMIEYGGGASVADNGALRIDGASTTLTNSIVRYSAADGISVFNDGAPYINGSQINDNADRGIDIDSTAEIAIVFSTVAGNGDGGIQAVGGGQYWVLNNHIVGNSGDPGVTVRNSASIGVIANNVIAANTHPNLAGGGIRIYRADVDISDNIIMDNMAYTGGGIKMDSIGGDKEIYVDGNIIVGNEATRDGGGIHFGSNATALIDHNVIAENVAGRYGGGLYVTNIGATNSIAVNAILHNQSADNGSGLWVSDSEANVFRNTIIDNMAAGLGGVYVENYPQTFENNNIYDNSDYDLFNGNAQGQPDLTVTDNWWFAFTPETIRSRIWDWYDDPSLGFVTFEPYRTDFVLDAPISPPEGLAAVASSTTMTVTWQANAEDDHAGYRLYYDTTPTFPYSGTGALEGDSYLDVGDVLSATLTGLDPGTYYVTVTAYDTLADDAHDQTDGNESWFAEPVSVMVPEVPGADFSAEPTSGVAPLEVTFSDHSTGTVYAWLWDFGDGATSVNQHPVHTYAGAGSYTVTLTASGPAGSDTLARSDYIQVYDPASASFSASPTSGVAPLTVDFSNESSGDYDSCDWTFGDGTSSDDCNDPQHTYTASGVYTVSLMVSGPGGSDTNTQSDYITVSEPATPPTAAFSASPTSGVAPLTVDFSNESTGGYDTCAWAFGDDGSSDDCNDPQHTYTASGVYTVSLMVGGSGGSDTNTKSDYITVSEPPPPPTAAFSASPTSGVAPLAVDFNNESSGDYDTCAWTFGDGDNSIDCSDPQHSYAAGSYTVTLAVSGLGGSDVFTRTAYIAAYEAVGAAFSASPTSGVAPLTVDFSNESSGDYDSCDWTFGDGDSSTDCNDPQHTYTASGVYTVSLMVSGFGGSDTNTKSGYITVSESGGPLTAAFSASPTSGVAPLAVDFNNESTGDYENCRWDFGDGATSTACAPPAHTYYTAGAFHVSLIVQGPEGPDSQVRQAYINAAAPDQVWISNGPDGGSVHDLVMAPSDADILYAATDRGVFKSTDGGDHWQATHHPALVVRTLAVAADNPAVVFSGSDDGVYKSVDGGDIWLHQGLDGARVNTLAIRHDDAQVIFAGVGKPRVINETMIGVFRSSDGGASWAQVYSDEDDDAVMDLVVDSDDGSIIYAAIMGDDQGLAKSQDGGDSWTKHRIGQDCSSDDAYALAMTPASAASRTLYAFGVGCEEDVYKSIDRGESWTATNTPAWWMADYPAALAVDPVDAQVVYVGVDDYYGQLLRSSNGGGSWTAVQNGMPEGNPTSIVVSPEDRGVYVAQEEGDIYRSGDLGNSWQLASLGVHNLAIDDLAIHPSDANVILAAINGQGHAIAATADDGDSWTHHPTPPADVDNGDTPAEVGALAYAPGDGSTLYAADAWEHYDLFLYKSTDGGSTWHEHQIVEVVNGSYEGMGASAIWVHPQDPDVVLVAVAGWDGAGLFRSFNGGSAWVRKLDIWTNAVTGDPNAPNTLYAATARCGYVYRSTDAGFTWEKITPGECWVWEVNDLVVTSEGDVLAATSAGLRRWDGDTWSQNSSLPAVALTAVAVDPVANPETIYVGTDGAGVFASHDGGATWSDLSAGLGDRAITELAIAGSPNRRLYAGTAGGGIWHWVLAGPTLDEHLWLPLVRR